jgi:hypothetical protein
MLRSVLALDILVTLTAAASVVFVLVLFVWAARKDGEEDRARRPPSH